MKMLGKISNPSFTAKAAETHGLVAFAHKLLTKHMPTFEEKGGEIELCAKLLQGCGKELINFNNIIKANDRNMSPANQRLLKGHFLKAAILYDRAAGVLRPKWHIMLHACDRISHFGSPRYYWTYKDESINGVVAKIARSCHRRAWAETVHRKYNLLKATIGKPPSMY